MPGLTSSGSSLRPAMGRPRPTPDGDAAPSLAALARDDNAGMGFFDDLPPPEPAPPRRHQPWEPPEAELPGIVPIGTLLLARTDQVAVAVTGLSAFSAGDRKSTR